VRVAGRDKLIQQAGRVAQATRNTVGLKASQDVDQARTTALDRHRLARLGAHAVADPLP
jgi:hypothetical protein